MQFEDNFDWNLLIQKQQKISENDEINVKQKEMANV